MTTQAKAELFHTLQGPGRLLLLPNCWDAGSARLLVELGAAAVATSSAALAWAHGYPDGERLPRDVLVRSVAEITRVVGVPVSVDTERGFGADAAQVGETVARLIGAGAIGINIEDGDAPPAELAGRIAAARAAAEREGVTLFINARTDLWLRGVGTEGERLPEAIRRGALYAGAGADGLFLPRLAAPEVIRAVATAVPLCINLMAVPDLPAAETLTGLGVRRASLGVMTLLKAYGALKAPVQAFLDEGRLSPMFEGAATFAEINGMFG